MILTARLHILGHEKESEGIPLLSCEYSFKQEIDERGLPVSKVKGGLIDISFISIDDSDIMYWMVTSQSDKSGQIIFSGEDGEKVFKTLEFIDARCVYYHDSFYRDGEMTTRLTISTREIKVSGTTHSNQWTNYDV